MDGGSAPLRSRGACVVGVPCVGVRCVVNGGIVGEEGGKSLSRSCLTVPSSRITSRLPLLEGLYYLLHHFRSSFCSLKASRLTLEAPRRQQGVLVMFWFSFSPASRGPLPFPQAEAIGTNSAMACSPPFALQNYSFLFFSQKIWSILHPVIKGSRRAEKAAPAGTKPRAQKQK